MDAAKLCAQQPRQPRPVGSWASIVVDSFDSKAILLAIEAKEASQHLVGLLMLVGVVVVLASSSILTYSGFLLYLVPLLLHLAWGWNALISAVLSLVWPVSLLSFHGCDFASRFFGWR